LAAAGLVYWGITSIRLPEACFWVDGVNGAESPITGFGGVWEYWSIFRIFKKSFKGEIKDYVDCGGW
jgi:hypothetical protein